MSERDYIELVDYLHNNGMCQDNRTGVDAIRKVFNFTEYNTNNGQVFNLFQHKQLPPYSIIGELVCFVQGKTSAADFRAQRCNVWNQNANEHGKRPNQWLSNPTRKGEDDLGPVYGKQWRRLEDIKLVPVQAMHQSNELMHFYEKLGYKSMGVCGGEGSPETYVMRREIDQLLRAVNDIKNNPTSRRIIIDAWTVGDLEFMALPPCHVLQHYLCTKLTTKERTIALRALIDREYMWHHYVDLEDSSMDVSEAYTEADNKRQQLIEHLDKNIMSDDSLDQWGAPQYRLDLVMFQRSADTILGTPYNVASYDAMLNLMAQITGTAPGSLFYLTSDTHIYTAHEDAVNEILTERFVLPEEKPRLLINPRIRNVEDLDTMSVDDFKVVEYENLGKLKSPTPMMV